MQLRFQRPRPPLLTAVAPYYQLSEGARHYSNGGPCARLLSERVSERLGVANVVPVANATIGLEVAITGSVVGNQPHRVIMPSFSFPATPLSASRTGHLPVFVDVDPASWQIDVGAVRAALSCSDAPTLVMGCTTFGTPPPDEDIASLRAVCEEFSCGLIIDAAAALGARATDDGWYGGANDLSVFSLHVTKSAATSEGGLIAVRSDETADLMGRLINFGFDESRAAAHRGATNGKMSEIEAAFSLAMLDDLDDVVAKRRRLVSRAQAEFPPGITWQLGVEQSTVQFISVALPAELSRSAVSSSLTTSEIEPRMNFAPLHLQPAFRSDETIGELNVTNDLSERILSLPMYTDMTDDELTWLIEALSSAVNR